MKHSLLISSMLLAGLSVGCSSSQKATSNLDQFQSYYNRKEKVNFVQESENYVQAKKAITLLTHAQSEENDAYVEVSDSSINTPHNRKPLYFTTSITNRSILPEISYKAPSKENNKKNIKKIDNTLISQAAMKKKQFMNYVEEEYTKRFNKLKKREDPTYWLNRYTKNTLEDDYKTYLSDLSRTFVAENKLSSKRKDYFTVHTHALQALETQDGQFSRLYIQALQEQLNILQTHITKDKELVYTVEQVAYGLRKMEKRLIPTEANKDIRRYMLKKSIEIYNQLLETPQLQKYIFNSHPSLQSYANAITSNCVKYVKKQLYNSDKEKEQYIDKGIKLFEKYKLGKFESSKSQYPSYDIYLYSSLRRKKPELVVKDLEKYALSGGNHPQIIESLANIKKEQGQHYYFQKYKKQAEELYEQFGPATRVRNETAE